MKDYLRSPSGRFISLAFALMFGAGAITVTGGTAYVWSTPAILMIFLAAVSGVVSAMTGLNEHPVPVLLSLIFLPIGGLLYIASLGAVLPAIPATGYVLAVLAAGALATALRPAPSAHAPMVRHAHAAGH